MNTHHVLIVDDDPNLTKVLSDILKTRGYSPAAVGTGRAALERIEEEPPGVALIDLRLDDMSGLEVMEGIKERWPATECIVLTGHASQASAIEAINLGAYSYVQKPYDAEQLLVTIRRAIEKREAEQTLWVSQAEFQDLYENAPVAYFAIGEDARIRRCNKRAEELLGYAAEELVGRPVLDLYADAPQGKDKASKVFQRFKDGEAVRDEELQMQKADGTPVWIILSVNAIRDSQGRIVESRSMVVDITERVKAESQRDASLEALRRSRDEWTSTFDAMSDWVSLLDLEARILRTNPAGEDLTGVPVAEMVGQTCCKLAHGTDEMIPGCPLQKMLRTHQREVVELHVPDGDRWLMITVEPVMDDEGNLIRAVHIVRDITERKQAEEEREKLQAQLLQSQKMEAVGQLTAGIAHDFNNLLTAINGFAQLIQLRLAPDDPVQEMVGSIWDSGQRAAGLVSQLMTFSRKQIIDPRVLDLNAVVADMDDMLRRVIREDVELEMVLGPDMWPVNVDPAQMEQVIVNLTVNAAHAMPDGGKLTIETSNVVLDEGYVADHLDAEPGEHVLVAVSDTGVGMSPEVQAHIFEPFFTTKERGEGTGLGLATVYGGVKQNGGHIRVHSQEGHGTTFKIYLPRAEESGELSPRGEGTRAMPAGGETILLVEDNPDVRDLARQVLENQGYTLLEAGDGPQALDVAASHAGPIHLLLTDVIMPGMSGSTLSERLVQSRPDVRVLYMSGYADDAIRHYGVLETGSAFLQKPFDSIDLAREVRAVLDE